MGALHTRGTEPFFFADENRQCEGTFLVDSGCTGAIMNSEFVFEHKLPWVRRADLVRVTGADGTLLTMRIGHHQDGKSVDLRRVSADTSQSSG
jgi:hypothetical protein